MSPQTYDISSKSVNKRVLEQSGNGSLEKIRCIPDENVSITSTNRGFPTKNHAVGTKEQIEKGLSYLYPKRNVERDGIHTRPLNLKNKRLNFLMPCIFFEIIPSNDFVQTFLQSFHIALSHISIRTRNKPLPRIK